MGFASRIHMLAGIIGLMGSLNVGQDVPNANVAPSKRTRSKGKRAGGRGGARRQGGRSFHSDPQINASLRHRMGGNAMRIKMARQGYVFLDPKSEMEPRWIESPTIQPEEVEVAVADYCKRTNYTGRVRFNIRDKLIHVERPFNLGPVQFQQLKVPA